MRHVRERCALLLALLTCAGTPLAADKKVTPSLEPQGPVTITADRAEFDKGGAMLYTGHVQLESDTLKLAGDRLELQQFENSQYTAKINGAPARMDHSGLAEDGAAPVPLSAQASTLNYDTRTGIVEIIGKATMTRGKDEINGENIRYNVAARRIEAAGGSGSQVKIVIQPQSVKKSKSGSKP